MKVSLKARLAIRVAVVLPLLAAAVFLPAGSLRFWQGWVFMTIIAGFSLAFGFYFLRRDPQLLQRRMRIKEREPAQKLFGKLFPPLWIVALVLAGLDYRFGWTGAYLSGVPLWLTLFAQALILYSYLLIFQVFRANSFASSTIQVEAGQKVVSTGPYGVVRHPMYSAILVMLLFAPLALGSYFAMPVFALLIPLLVIRLLNEEQVLRRELPGYPEYCLRTRFRLVPLVW